MIQKQIEKLELQEETTLFQKTADNMNALAEKINEIIEAHNLSLSHSPGEYNPYDLGTPIAPGYKTTNASTGVRCGKLIQATVGGNITCANPKGNCILHDVATNSTETSSKVAGEDKCDRCGNKGKFGYDHICVPSPRDGWRTEIVDECYEHSLEGLTVCGKFNEKKIISFIENLLSQAIQEKMSRLRAGVVELETKDFGNTVFKRDVLSLIDNNTTDE